MKNALIIVDAQNDFFEGGALAVKDSLKIIPLINYLVKESDCAYATQDWHQAKNKKHFKKWPTHCVQDTKGAKLHPDIDSKKIGVIIKKGISLEDDGYSGFESNLHEFLQKDGVTHLYIVGLAIDYCVKATALDAKKKGYKTHILIDVCRGVDKKTTAKAIEEMKAVGIEIL